MNIIEEEVQVIREKLLCEDCGLEVTSTGGCLTSNPPQYTHKCQNGHEIRIIGKTYPLIRYRRNIQVPKKYSGTEEI